MNNEKIKCALCGKQFSQITGKHLKNKHNVSYQEYIEQFPNHPLRSEKSKLIKSISAKKTNENRKGKKRDPKVVEKIKQTKRETPRAAWNKGIPKTEEEKNHLSKTRKQKIANGEIVHWNQGNKTPTETKEKIRKTALSQNRTHSKETLEKRKRTFEKKKEDGWIHPSTVRMQKGIKPILSPESRQKMLESTKKANENKTEQKIKRIAEHLKQYDIDFIKQEGQYYHLHCNVCDHYFTRTLSVIVPYRYQLYQGKYCPKCFPQIRGIYTEHYFNIHPNRKNINGSFYVVNLFNQNESFIKIGITTRTAERRLINENKVYNFNIILEIDMKIYDAFKLEQSLLNSFNNFKYDPVYSFGGRTECFSIDILKQMLYSVESKKHIFK